MTDVELVIKIPKDIYDECNGNVYFPDTGAIVWDAVGNSTLLDDVLDKIKVEIESELVDYVYETDGIYNSGLDKAIEIINKYKKKARDEE